MSELTTKIHDWKGNALSGQWSTSIKLDGVRAISNGHAVTSKHGKPLYNLDHLAHTFTDAEIYCGSLLKTISAVRASRAVLEVKPEHVYSIDPLDSRLLLGTLTNPTEAQIRALMSVQVLAGFEGIVLRQNDKWIKVKEHATHDVSVLAVQCGTGKYAGMMGALLTERGAVGTGFTDVQRIEFSEACNIVGQVIEVQCQKLTDAQQFRHASFVRVRFDKAQS